MSAYRDAWLSSVGRRGVRPVLLGAAAATGAVLMQAASGGHIIAGYLVVGRSSGGGWGSGTVQMHGSGQHHLSIVSEKAYRVVVRSD